MKYLGIDFGTTFTKAAIFDTEKDQTVLVELNPDNTDFGFGKTKYAMPTIVLVNITPYNRSYEVGHKAQNMKRYPGTFVYEKFKTSLDSDNDCVQTNPDITYQELIQAIFTHVYNTAKLQALSDFDRVVITVPASTIRNSPRWQRMYNAARNTFGSNMVIDIIYEPEAAGFALLNDSLKKDPSIDGKTFLVYDFGGGTFDASVFQVKDEQIFIIGESIGSDDQRKWGGVYIDDIILKDYKRNGSIINTIIGDIENKGLREQMKIEEMLRMEPIKAKIALSTSTLYQFALMDYTLNVEHFNDLIRPMIDDTITYSKSLLELKAEEGTELSLQDIKKIFLVGGTSRLQMIPNAWSKEQNKNSKASSFEMEHADIEIVAIGASKYNHLRVSPDRLIELGILRLSNKDYSQAALYFRNSETPLGNYLLGLLFFEGLIGNKRNYRKAIQYFEKSDNEQSNAMLAKCSFQGRQGLPRNHEMAKAFLQKAGKLELTTKLQTALNTSTPSQNTLDYIYKYNPIEDALSSFDIAKLQSKYQVESAPKSKKESELLNSQDSGNVQPCCPDLNYSDLMRLANTIKY
jgi:molecular chaperone DnaK (HSP70)